MIAKNSAASPRILIFGDDRNWSEQLSGLLDANSYDTIVCTAADEARALLADRDVAVMIHSDSSDSRDLPAVTDLARRTGVETLTCDHRGERHDDRVLAEVARAAQQTRLRAEVTRLRQHVAWNYGFDNLVGSSAAMEKVREMARRLAPTDINILIAGPAGSGRELVARTIHHHSNRRTGPLVSIDCAAVPATLFEQELFGYAAGCEHIPAFTGTCLLQDADGGTLILKDIQHLEVSTQIRLREFLRHSTLLSAGGAQKRVDIRIIVTADAPYHHPHSGPLDIELLQKMGQICIELPPLSKRSEDLEILCEYFLRHHAAEKEQPQPILTRPAIDKLLAHNWPGNVGELENSLRRAATFCPCGIIDAVDISFADPKEPAGLTVEHGSTTLTIKGGLLDTGQRALIAQALIDNNWNFTRTAAELGIGRTTLWRKVKKYKLRKEPVPA